MDTHTETITKEQALANYLDIPTEWQELEGGEEAHKYAQVIRIEDSLTKWDEYDTPEGEFRVLTDDEAEEALLDSIRESAWAFNSSFLSSFTELPEEVFTALQPQCEGANEAILALIAQGDGLEAFAEEAVTWDGRGHFLNHYDGTEEEQDGYYIYRTN